MQPPQWLANMCSPNLKCGTGVACREWSPGMWVLTSQKIICIPLILFPPRAKEKASDARLNGWHECVGDQYVQAVRDPSAETLVEYYKRVMQQAAAKWKDTCPGAKADASARARIHNEVKAKKVKETALVHG